MKYRKKPVIVDAYQTDKEIIIHTLEGNMKANVGDYIITGVQGEQYPCKPDIFEQTYEMVMPDKKLTDSEIIKALEDCFNKDHTFVTTYDGKSQAITKVTMQDILNVFNRQKAENQNLKGHLEQLKSRYDNAKAEIERLKPLEENLDKLLYMLNAVDMGQSVLEEQKHTIKAEAYKEFAERLRFEIVNKPSEFKASQATVDFLSGHAHRHHEILDILDNLLKELVGEDQ